MKQTGNFSWPADLSPLCCHDQSFITPSDPTPHRKMSSKPFVVVGEARESDSEEEIDSSTTSKDPAESSKGKIVYGEAPESDEEICANSGSLDSISSAVSALSAPSLNKKKKSSRKYESVLIRKLYERNASLYKNMNEFIEQTATNAGNELNAANRRLLKCQLQVQEGADYLRIINSNLTTLDSSLKLLLSTNYLPEIRIDETVDQYLASRPP